MTTDASASEGAPTRDVLTFGETMLRLSPPGWQRLAQSPSLDVWVAGSESNVAAALCVLGVSVTWVSRLPGNPLGDRIAARLRACGIDVTNVVRTPASERVGTFYAEAGAPPRRAQVVYDRAGSAASFLGPMDLPEALFDRHRHLHVTGITPALSASCAEAVRDAVRRAKERGRTVSLDVNYRAKLWTPGQAARFLTPLLPQIDVLFCSRGDAAGVFGVAGDDRARALGLWERFGVPWIALTAGADGAVGCLNGGVCTAVPAFPVEATVERLGSGDAFAGGVLAGFLARRDPETCLRLGAAAGALKRTILGDMLIATEQEVLALLERAQEDGWR